MPLASRRSLRGCRPLSAGPRPSNRVHGYQRTKSDKFTKLAVHDVVMGREVKNKEALGNPDALELFRGLKEQGISQHALFGFDSDIEESEYGGVAFIIVDVSEGGGSDEGPHCRHGKLVRQSRIAGHFTSRRHQCAQGATLLSIAVCRANRKSPCVPREVAPTPMPLVLYQGSRPLQDLNFSGFRHGNSRLR